MQQSFLLSVNILSWYSLAAGTENFFFSPSANPLSAALGVSFMNKPSGAATLLCYFVYVTVA